MNAVATVKEWQGVSIFLVVQLFAFGGFVYTVRDQLANVTVELRGLNRTVSEGQVVTAKLVEHMLSIDREVNENRERVKVLEARR